MSSYLPSSSRRLKLHYSQQGTARSRAPPIARRRLFRIAPPAVIGVALALWLGSIRSRVKNQDVIIERIQEEQSTSCPVPGSHETVVDDAFLDAMFLRLTTDARFAHYKPQILNPPSTLEKRPPWILILDSFLPSHAETLKHLQSESVQRHFSLSTLASSARNRTTNNQYRKSSSYNCAGACLQQDWVLSVVQGIQDVTGLSMRNAEDITFTHYQAGGFYGKHHDYILQTTNPKAWQNCGPRILTFLVFLNTVEQGGATNFFHLDVSVQPQPGRALVFPNVFPSHPMDKDERTAHEALVVEKGEKYIAQTWLHPFDYQANMKNKCC